MSASLSASRARRSIVLAVDDVPDLFRVTPTPTAPTPASPGAPFSSSTVVISGSSSTPACWTYSPALDDSPSSPVAVLLLAAIGRWIAYRLDDMPSAPPTPSSCSSSTTGLLLDGSGDRNDGGGSSSPASESFGLETFEAEMGGRWDEAERRGKGRRVWWCVVGRDEEMTLASSAEESSAPEVSAEESGSSTARALMRL